MQAEKMSVEIQVKYRYTASQDPEEGHFQALIKFLAEQQRKIKKEKNRKQNDRSTVLPR